MINSNLIGGLALLLFGSGYLWEAFRYPMGTLRNIGPGGFPLLIGVLIVAIACILLTRGFLQRGERPQISIRPFITISGSIVIFGVLINTLGLMAAIVGTVFTAAISEPQIRLVRTAILAVFLVALSWVIFVFALGMPLQLVRMP